MNEKYMCVLEYFLRSREEIILSRKKDGCERGEKKVPQILEQLFLKLWPKCLLH